MEGMEMICFQIISSVGSARSNYIEAIHEAKKGDYEAAKKLIEEGKEMFVAGHAAHAQLVQQEAAGDSVQVQLLLVHAEDQLMSAEAFGILAEEFMDVYKTVRGEA